MNPTNCNTANVPEGAESNFNEAAYMFDDIDYKEFYLTTIDIPKQENTFQPISYCALWVRQSGICKSKSELFQRS